ncbi:sulfatase-like hydrolase/transferase [Helicobacter baculiformis]|uniref:Sulfatase-like hydrolase/transferase n=1 Tax=Helicobacter baculiformis TaxID=427351 RepID=A0ABV7ZFZ5_9HELI|nr:sulfatase-like hydrolase/transferase [Helicobacter baculiformis]
MALTAYSVISLILFHAPLLHYILDHQGGFGLVLSVGIAYICTTNIVFIIFSMLGNRCMQAMMALFSLCNAIAFYYIHTYHVFLTKNMLGNVLHTNINEAGELLGGSLWVYTLGGLGVGAFFYILPIQKGAFRAKVWLFVSSVCLFAIWGFTHAKQWLFFDHHAKYIGGLSLPYSYSVNALRVLLASWHQNPPKLLDNVHPRSDKAVIVLAIGESARRANYGIYGYTRATTPKLQDRLNRYEILALKATSCATYTTAALTCMLTSQKGYENLPSFLHRQGVKVVWLSLNSAEPPMSIDWQPSKDTWQKWLKSKGVEAKVLNFDMALAHALPFLIARYPNDNLLIVLHLKGSHGPLYVDKIPRDFTPFKPICTHSEPNTCDLKSLVNAYDNTIAYNDLVLDTMINTLQHTQRQALLLYMSDHGESLGEYGMYLHGAPFLLAPSFQKEIPFIVYANDLFKKAHAFKPLQDQYSQEMVFSSILGAFGMQGTSNAYSSDLDIFKAYEHH